MAFSAWKLSFPSIFPFMKAKVGTVKRHFLFFFFRHSKQQFAMEIIEQSGCNNKTLGSCSAPAKGKAPAAAKQPPARVIGATIGAGGFFPRSAKRTQRNARQQWMPESSKVTNMRRRSRNKETPQMAQKQNSEGRKPTQARTQREEVPFALYETDGSGVIVPAANRGICSLRLPVL